MMPVILIAANYLREQRWALILLLLWVVFSAAVVMGGQFEVEDALFFFKQQAIYGVAFSAFVAASAIHNDRRSRRILAVLSKGIERRQYVAGLVAGLMLLVTVYCLAMGVFGSLMFRAMAIPHEQLWFMLALLMVACALAGTTATLFATFLPPLVAVAMTAIALGTNVAFTQLGVTPNVLPVFALTNTIAQFQFKQGWHPQWSTAWWGIGQSVALWLIASWIFGRKDIAVAVE